MNEQEQQDLGALIEQLRSVIDESKSLSNEDRTRLETLMARVETRADEDEGIVDHLEDALSQFETEHLDLVRIINRIANVLSAGGI